MNIFSNCIVPEICFQKIRLAVKTTKLFKLIIQEETELATKIKVLLFSKLFHKYQYISLLKDANQCHCVFLVTQIIIK